MNGAQQRFTIFVWKQNIGENHLIAITECETRFKLEMSFAVLGAGVVGLSTALELQDTYPTAQVNLIADKFGRDTTSDVAAGIFRPGPSFTGPTDNITRFDLHLFRILSDKHNFIGCKYYG